ncbi:MAG: histidine phosphatase family protein [Marivibrio sp.]|uniref:histidine phosphatase family protein n=1 Tax=Marivibrio sp. TaxID=2039719 RepID=UPI0032EF3D5A
MTRLVLIRHAPTPWNREKRLQGRTDTPLDAAGERWVARWRLPEEARGVDAVSSPLARARRTAEILLDGPVATDPRLAEMGYGAWEGERLPDLRARLGRELARLEAAGWDFHAPGGESPRAVWARLAPFLRDSAAAGVDRVAVCHNGVIRTILAVATGWNFTGKPPAKLRDGAAHFFQLDADGGPSVERLNLPLTAAPPPGPQRPPGDPAGPGEARRRDD